MSRPTRYNDIATINSNLPLAGYNINRNSTGSNAKPRKA